ncbi:YczE/YyaS/YitT family protein [Streptococcus caprae]|uniref:YitT family protein n=1 Tax=Streptococcus caprae TaxID=1640501 RepID=A0ABV8CVT4_9STRE
MLQTKINGKTLLVYLLGNLVLAFGVCLNTKTSLGVAPVTSVPYVISQILNLPLSVVNFVFLSLLIGVQFLLLGKAFRLLQMTQVFASFLGSAFIQLFDQILVVPDNWTWRILAMLLGITATGIGASVTVGMRVIPNPADALAETIGLVCKRNFGFGKNILDACAISLSLSLGLLARGHIIGIGLGTAVAMVLTGRVIALCHPYTEKLYSYLTKDR